jgi:transcription elongation factor Elf1
VTKRIVDKSAPGHLEDFRGNNIAFNCPVCGKVLVVNGILDKNGRECPNCGKSRGFVDERGRAAFIEYDVASSIFLKLT